MKTILYLANQQLQIVTGTGTGKSVNVKNCITEDTPEGSIINGIVMDNEAFKSFLTDLKRQNKLPAKDVTLVINSSKFVGRSIDMPIMSDKKALKYIERDYLDMGRGDNSIFSYITISKGRKFQKVYADSIEPDFIKDYISIFATVGIKLNAIYSSENTLINYIGSVIASHVKTYDVVIADGNTLTTVLFVDGVFNYYNSVRSFYEPGSPEYAADIAKTIRNLTQFMKSNQLEAHLEKIYLAGVSPDFMPTCEAAIADVGVHTAVRPFNFKSNGEIVLTYQKYVKAVAGLIAQSKTTDFMYRYNNYLKHGKDEEKEDSTHAIPIIVAAIVVMLIAFAVSTTVRNKRFAELERLNEQNEAMMFDVYYYEALMQRSNFLTGQHNSIAGLDANLKTYPRGNSKVLKVFDKCAKGYAEVRHNSFDAEAGVITITAFAEDVERINQFIKRLTEQDEFSSVDYTGYSYDENTAMWNINVTCILAESAGL